MRKIISLHGYLGKADNRNYQVLCSLFQKENVISPQIDYNSESPYEILCRINALADAEGNNVILVGQSLGGFHANLISRKKHLPCLLTNPCLLPHTCEVVRNSAMPEKFLAAYGEYASLAKNPDAWILCSDKDEIIAGNPDMCAAVTPHLRIVSGSHSKIQNLKDELRRTLAEMNPGT